MRRAGVANREAIASPAPNGTRMHTIPVLTGRVLSALSITTLFATTTAAQDRRTVSGSVVDSAGQPIPHAMIDGGPQARTLTNLSGEFRLQLPPRNRVEIQVRRIGYLPGKVLVQPGGDTTVAVTLTQLGILMETQVIRAREQVQKLNVIGFYDRMNDATRGALAGEFILPEEIEMRRPNRATQMLEGRRGIRVQRFGNCYDITTCYRITGTGGCAATVYVDNQRLNRFDDESIGNAPSIDDIVGPTAISAMEVYPRGSSAPPRYQSLAGTCAIVVIWTK